MASLCGEAGRQYTYARFVFMKLLLLSRNDAGFVVRQWQQACDVHFCVCACVLGLSAAGEAFNLLQGKWCKSFAKHTVGDSMSIIMSFDLLDVFATSLSFFDICQAGPQEFLRRQPADLRPK